MSSKERVGAGLLAADEPPAVSVHHADGTSDIVLACDHAGRRIPRSLGSLGLSDLELSSHVAWDVGAAAVACALADRLDATLVMQTYSRLVIDCNRPLNSPDSITLHSEWGEVSGNRHLDAQQRLARRAEIFEPYHAALRDVLDRRQQQRRPTLLVALHSFTPAYRGLHRPWHIGFMYRQDARVAATLIELLRRDERLQVGDNEPYAIEDASDYTLPTHGESRHLPHVGIEIRQDQIAHEAGQKSWAGRLASLFRQLEPQRSAT